MHTPSFRPSAAGHCRADSHTMGRQSDGGDLAPVAFGPHTPTTRPVVSNLKGSFGLLRVAAVRSAGLVPGSAASVSSQRRSLVQVSANTRPSLSLMVCSAR